MEPVIDIGDLFLIQPYHPSLEFLTKVQIGDIIVFKSTSGLYIVHRVIGETASGFVTKGDNNPFTDQQGGEPFVTREKIVGKALTFQGSPIVIPKAGLWIRQFSTFFRRNTFLVAGGIGTAGGLLLFFSKKTTRSFIKRRHSRNNGIKIKHLYMISLGVLSLAILVPMIGGMTTNRIEYVVTEHPITSERSIVKGGVLNRTLTLSNKGLVPFYAFLSSPNGNVDIKPATVLQYPGSPTEIEIQVEAEDNIGYYEKEVYVHKYLPILPLPALSALIVIHPYLPILAMEFLLLSPFIIAYFFINERRTRLNSYTLRKLKRRFKTW
jgi:signal peptidase